MGSHQHPSSSNESNESDAAFLEALTGMASIDVVDGELVPRRTVRAA